MGDFDDEDADFVVEDNVPNAALCPAQLPQSEIINSSTPLFIQPVVLHEEHDEALQKHRSCNISSLLNPDPRPHSITATDPKSTTAEVLGPKTGKHEFFAAREENKLQFTQREQEVVNNALPAPMGEPQSSLPTTTTEHCPPPVTNDQASTVKVSEAEPAGKSDYVQELAKSVLLDSGERFLNSPLPVYLSPVPPVVAATPAMDDLVSAADFYQKKLLAKEEAASRTSLKRKAEDMSTGNDAPVPSTSERKVLTAVGKTKVIGDEPPAKRNATEAAKKNVEREMGEPSTRGKGTAWMLAERAGLVALGGAMVLGSLIYSAPTF